MSDNVVCGLAVFLLQNICSDGRGQYLQEHRLPGGLADVTAVLANHDLPIIEPLDDPHGAGDRWEVLQAGPAVFLHDLIVTFMIMEESPP